MTKLYLIALLSTFFFIAPHTNAKVKLKEGFWYSTLKLNESTILPFEMEVVKNKKEYVFSVFNANEKIEFTKISIVNDSINIEFKDFKSTLRFVQNNKKCIKGFWINHNKKGNYRIPFSSTCSNTSRFNNLSIKEPDLNVTGNWKVTFDYQTKEPYLAVGVFNQKTENGYVEGTFLTETGDYRFLEGQVGGNKFNLSCFDGSHAFLFESEFKNDTLWGSFYSGKHWKTKWYAVRNEKFSLRDSDSITYLKSVDYPFNFTLKDLYGESYTYPNRNLEDKVVIIQIMGTWCPNCLDETKYYKELHDKYNSRGLEIISIGYETPDSFLDQAARIERLRNMYDLDFKFLVGGKASKSLASEHFNMLNHIVSFPTSIYINKAGKVVRIHTGFNGPGTGEKFTEYTLETERLIKQLLEE